MMRELDVKINHAHSPQAKGRVERSNATHQDRLVKELRLRNISNMEEANIFLRDHYIKEHNDKFAQPPASLTDVHRSIKNIDLDKIMCIKEIRILNNDFTVIFNKRIFQLEAKQSTIIRPKDQITVHLHMNGAVMLYIRAIQLCFHELQARPQKQQEGRKLMPCKPYQRSENSRRWASGLSPVLPPPQPHNHDRVE